MIANVSTAGLFALAILAALYLMKDVVVPVILAWVVANILSPVVTWLENHKVKRGTAVALVTVAMMAMLAIIGLSQTPKKGYSTPAATGTPSRL